MEVGDIVKFLMTFPCGKIFYVRRNTEGIVKINSATRPTVLCVAYDSRFPADVNAKKKYWEGTVPVEFLMVIGRQTTLEDQMPIGCTDKES